jgi:hypothetical protein
MKVRLPLALGALALLLSACAQPGSRGQADEAQATLSPAAIEADIRTLQAGIQATHPDPGYTMDHARFERALVDIRSQLTHALSADEAWRLLAMLNPVFADGHLSVGFPDWRAQATAHLAGGGTLFPFEVHVDAGGKVIVVSELGGGRTSWKGREIISINGVPTAVVAAQLLARTPGDTPAFRAALLSKRWWLYHWKMYGAPARYELRFAGRSESESMCGSALTPAVLRDAQDFERNFLFRLIEPDTALLTIRTFSWEDKDRYFAFTQDAFARIREAGATTLVIDIRDNGGGDDDLWMRGIVRYIADKPYRWGSSYKKKIIEAYRDEGETNGEVKVGEIESEIAPEANNPLAFHGTTYVVIGPYTYSSAILFANVVHDYGFATLAGTGGAAKRGQTGGIQLIPLPNSGLELVCPRFYLLPPSGGAGQQLLQPDIHLQEDPLDPGASIRQLLASRSVQESKM